MKKSIKVLFAVALLFTATQSANAQFERASNRIPSPFHFGIRGGFTSHVYAGEDETSDAFIFPTGGIAMDFQLGKIPLFLGIGANYVNYGYKYETRYEEETEDAHSLQVPLTTSYHINVAPNLFINPFLGGFAAYNFNDDFAKQFNAGLRFGCGMNFGRLTLDIGYDMGLVNLGAKEYGERYDVYTGTLFMTIGVNFAGSR